MRQQPPAVFKSNTEVTMEKKTSKAITDDLLVTIPRGRVEMRDDRIKRVWEVEIDAFLLSKFPVTQDVYEAITHKNPSTFRGHRLPVETVSWMDAIVFCNELSELSGKHPCYAIDQETKKVTLDPSANGFRLPTEAEWQYACQAGTKQIRYNDLELIGWYKENSKNRTHDVGLKKPNAWGLYDMLGNVWEWCSDIYDETVYGSYRVFRGGGWCDVERSVMATTRRRSHPFSFRIDDLGFRIARSLD